MTHKFYALTATLLFMMGVLIAQPVPNRVESDCNANSRSVYNDIAAGKVLVIVASAHNCGICRTEADNVNDFANDNASTIAVWGAMNRLGGGDSDCTSNTSWQDDYSWSNVFMFNDEDDYWVDGSYPYFTVIDPNDTTIAYEGSDLNMAKSVALSLVNTVGIDEATNTFEVNDVFPNPFADELTIAVNTSGQQIITVRLFDIIGNEVYADNHQVSTLNNEVILDLSDKVLEEGVYLLRIKVGEELKTFRLMHD